MQGGLATKRPPTTIQPNQSPDLSNVLIRDGQVRKRGGFQPVFRDRMRGNAVKNVQWRTTARLALSSGSADGDVVVSPGMMVAGHRASYEDGDGLAISLWFKPDELVSEHAGNATLVGAAYASAPYTVKILPIISKGPVKKSDVAHGVSAPSLWGVHANSGMPFCLYLWNNGTGANPDWQLRLSAHVFVGGVWTLQTVTSSILIAEQGRYHATASVSGSRVRLRVTRYRDPSETTVTDDEVTFTGTLAWNKCPIQVFDCPQELVQSTSTGTATVRPGLGYGWFFNSMRPAMTIDDITIWGEEVDLATLDRRDKVVPDGTPKMINHWSMNGPSIEYLTEDTGRGNHLFFVPRGPTFVNDDGGKEGGSFFFNGVTSCAQINCGTAAWRGNGDGTLEGAFYSVIRQNMAHGIAVDFWLDSIEPRYEQVICEIHSVMRLSITATGALKVYVRDGTPGGTIGAPTTFQAIGADYQSVVTGVTFAPGRRYHLSVLRIDGGTNVDVYLDGKLMQAAGTFTPNNYDNQAGGTATTTGNSYPPSGITIGFGSLERTIRGPDAANIAGVWQLNTDFTTGFIGRIESFSILTGAAAVQNLKRHGPESHDDWRFKDSRTWSNPRATLRDQAWTPEQIDTVRNAGRGSVLSFGTQRDGGNPFPIAIDATSGVTYYQLAGDSAVDNTAADVQGHQFFAALPESEGLGAHVYYVFAYYRFNIDGKRDRAAGAYHRGWERGYNGGTALVSTTLRNESKHVHVQYSSVGDQIGHIAGVYLLTIEADWQIQTDAVLYPVINSRGWTYRNRPYAVRSPYEFGLQWVPSLADDPVGTTPVTLYADYDVQAEGRRLGVAACAKNIYWARKAWDDGNLLFTGGRGSYVKANTNNLIDLDLTQVSGAGDVDPMQVTFWCKPLQMDGFRTLLSKRYMGSGIESVPDWMIYTDSGSITIAGTTSLNKAWRWVEGYANSANDNFLGSNSLKVGVWNHVCVQFHPTDLKVWVNGELIGMLDTVTLTGSEQTGNYSQEGAGVAPTQLWIGGYPEDFGTSPIGLVAPTITFDEMGWFGYIADVQAMKQLDTTRFSGNKGFPRLRYEQDPNSLYSWALNEGSGHLLNNTGATTSAFNAELHIREFELLKSGVRQDPGRHYDSVNFRDSLIATNGADFPLKAKFLGFDKSESWRVEKLGMDTPVIVSPTLVGVTTAGTGITVGTYFIDVAFVNDEGLVSDAVRLATYELAVEVSELAISVRGIPRSSDPQVVRRRIYVSAAGGGTPIFNRDIYDNDTWWADVTVYQSAGVASDAGNRGPAPRARHCAIAGSSLCLADLPDVTVGQNAFAFSTNNEASYFPLSTTVIIDSEDGRPIVGIGHNLGEVFFSKRNSVYKLSVGAVVSAIQLDAEVRLVQASDGCGGGVADGDNMLFGGGDRGVFRFNNVDLLYLTDEIERTWRTVDRSNEGLYGMFGAFWRSYSQYWVGVRLAGTVNDSILVFDSSSGSWTKFDNIEHSWMGQLEVTDGDPVIAVGGLDGRIYGYQDESIVDRATEDANALGAVTLSASTGLSGSATQLTIASGRFDTILAGLAGAEVTIVYSDGSSSLTATRKIENNSALDLHWSEALPSWVSFTSFTIGAISAYWTSPWMRLGGISKSQLVHDLHLEFEPNAGSLQVEISAIQGNEGPARAWPLTGSEQFPGVPMLTGNTMRPLLTRANRNGIYHRFRCGTYGIQDPFALQRYSIQASESRSRAVTGRTS
tara:strand:- start:19551 stop:24731 length:5181 start_codon:yes stop_codon:yes gene_type:complete